MEQTYLEALKTILNDGELISNRTGIKAFTYPHMMIKHNMREGFPLLTTKKMAWNAIKVELEFFIKGLTNKQWLQDRKCYIWDEWCNPTKIPNNLNKEEKIKFQKEEKDLGKIYGYQWRNFNSQGKDQLKHIIHELKNNPTNRQLICSAWNPNEIEEQALPPCHVLWHVFTTNDKLHLSWFQRSVDFFLGYPFNQASYALLLHLLCRETGLEEGTVTGFLSNCHIYENHVQAVKNQLDRKPFNFPTLETFNFKSVLEWQSDDSVLNEYRHHPPIKADIAI
jgi:thymidylate synthase